MPSVTTIAALGLVAGGPCLINCMSETKSIFAVFWAPQVVRLATPMAAIDAAMIHQTRLLLPKRFDFFSGPERSGSGDGFSMSSSLQGVTHNL